MAENIEEDIRMINKNGFGTFTYPNQDRYEGEWFNGKQNGKGVFIKNNGARKEGRWNMGKLDNVMEYKMGNLISH